MVKRRLAQQAFPGGLTALVRMEAKENAKTPWQKLQEAQQALANRKGLHARRHEAQTPTAEAMEALVRQSTISPQELAMPEEVRSRRRRGMSMSMSM